MTGLTGFWLLTRGGGTIVIGTGIWITQIPGLGRIIMAGVMMGSIGLIVRVGIAAGGTAGVVGVRIEHSQVL